MLDFRQIPKLKNYTDQSLLLIAGPCAIEGEQIAVDIAGRIREITNRLQMPFVFKGSYRKANRSRIDSFTGIGDERALSILKNIGDKMDLPTTTDIHADEEAAIAAAAVDILQIPAFLCRQTNLLIAAARTNKIVNVKKGQFLSAESMKHVYNKLKDSGNEQIILTERGTFFGYQDLVVDYRTIPIMQSLGAKVILDCTHSLQQPNQNIGITGGRPEMIETIAKAGVAVGVDGLFLETHPKPSEAKSDGANMLNLDLLEPLLERLLGIRAATLK